MAHGDASVKARLCQREVLRAAMEAAAARRVQPELQVGPPFFLPFFLPIFLVWWGGVFLRVCVCVCVVVGGVGSPLPGSGWGWLWCAGVHVAAPPRPTRATLCTPHLVASLPLPPPPPRPPRSCACCAGCASWRGSSWCWRRWRRWVPPLLVCLAVFFFFAVCCFVGVGLPVSAAGRRWARRAPAAAMLAGCGCWALRLLGQPSLQRRRPTRRPGSTHTAHTRAHTHTHTHTHTPPHCPRMLPPQAGAVPFVVVQLRQPESAAAQVGWWWWVAVAAVVCVCHQPPCFPPHALATTCAAFFFLY